MTRFPLSRLALAVLGALHFIAAPCVMAMTFADAESPCEHCPPGSDAGPCLATAADPGASGTAPGTDRFRPAVPPATVMVLPPPAVPVAIIPHRASHASRIALATGRHSGDPPLRILQQKFRN